MPISLESRLASLDEYGTTCAIVQLGETPDADMTVSYAELDQSVSAIANGLRAHAAPGASIGIVASNSVEWIQADLALLLGGYAEVSVPLGFTADQAAHLIGSCTLVLVDEPGLRRIDSWRAATGVAFLALAVVSIKVLRSRPAVMRSEPARHDWICKIIHTSGTTSRPKGVKIRAHALDVVVDSLLAWTQPGDYARYLNLVPFSLLLEQITALYLPFVQGGCVILSPSSQPPLGEIGASVADKLALMPRAAPSALTLTPSLVDAISATAERIAADGPHALSRAIFGTESVPLLAAGGGPVSPYTLHSLAQRGIDVLVGYGLSENSSVACWNPRDANRIGTVGKPLPHVECRISEEGELGIRSAAAFAGYIGADPSACDVDDDGWLWTGDLATMDRDGYVSVVGRKKNLIITAHGRNVSPEFVEATYRQVDGVVECVVLGDQAQSLAALIVIADDGNAERIQAALVAHGNTQLSSVERVYAFHCVAERDCPRTGLFTVTGRPRREEVARYLQAAGFFSSLV